MQRRLISKDKNQLKGRLSCESGYQVVLRDERRRTRWRERAQHEEGVKGESDTLLIRD